MISLVSKKYKKLKRGAYTKAETLARLFPTKFRSVEISGINSIEEIRSTSDKLVFFTQTSRMYGGKYNQALQEKSDLVFTRPESNLAWFNSTTNGFSVYRTSNIKQFHPIVVSEQYSCSQEDKVTIGIYNRPDIVTDSFDKLVKFLDKHKVNLITMGEELGISHPHILSYKHTNDSKEFFSSLTHYYMPMSSMMQDPWPNTLVEAVNSEAQIIVDLVDRDFEDGIDDILGCIDYHTDLTDKYYDNSNSVLMMPNWLNYYKYLGDNNFEYYTKEYSTFRYWCEAELGNF